MCAACEARLRAAITRAATQIAAVRDKLHSAELAPYVKDVYRKSKAEAFKNFVKIYGNSAGAVD